MARAAASTGDCASPSCNGVFIDFVDASRSGRCRYRAPEVCGNRVNVANHCPCHRATHS